MEKDCSFQSECFVELPEDVLIFHKRKNEEKVRRIVKMQFVLIYQEVGQTSQVVQACCNNKLNITANSPINIH